MKVLKQNPFEPTWRCSPPPKFWERGFVWCIWHFLIAHPMKCNTVMPVVWYAKSGKRMCGARCLGCGELIEIHPSRWQENA